MNLLVQLLLTANYSLNFFNKLGSQSHRSALTYFGFVPNICRHIGLTSIFITLDSYHWLFHWSYSTCYHILISKSTDFLLTFIISYRTNFYTGGINTNFHCQWLSNNLDSHWLSHSDHHSHLLTNYDIHSHYLLH